MKKKFTLLLLLLLAGITANADPIQINTQEDFDNWVAGIKDGSISVDTDVDLNTDITVVGTGCIVENYKGVFEGNYHTINLQLNRVESDQGLALIRDLDGTFQNAYITGTIEGNGQFFASVAQDLNEGSLVKNVHSSVDFISHINGDGTHGGIAARCEGAATLKNIIYSGKMFNPEGGTHSCGGLVGWVNIKSSFENCLMIGDVSEIKDSECNTIGRHPESIDGKNLFATMEKNQTPASCTIVSPEELASGMVCYLMNGNQEDISWWQTIGTDAVPTFDNRDGSHKQVFAVGDFRCDGTPLGELTYNNEAGSAFPDHSYTGGLCENCGQAQPGFLTEEDGWYIITTPEQLCYIAIYASANPETNIKIAADLDMGGYNYTPIMGGYSGTFDGQHHTISNLIIDNPAANDQALIGVAGTCTVKNLTLDSSCYISGASYCAGFVGQTNGAVTLTMEGLFMHGNVTGTGANIAAIHGCNMENKATIIMTNCGMSGIVVGAKESGLISGYFGTDKITLNGVWAIGTVTGSDNDTDAVFGRPNFGVTYNNCWSVQGSHSSIGTISADAVGSGELTWKLNGNQREITWWQTIGADAMPVLDNRDGSHKQVFAVGDFRCDGTPLSEGVTYNNESGSTVPEHSYDNGICDNCGQPQPGFVTEEDGWYIITTPEQLCYIADFASVHPRTNIKIAADLDMSGYEYRPIMGGYSGTFDGQHHIISNLVIDNPANDQALIGVAGTCTVKNLTLDSSCYISGASYCAGFVGQTNGAVTLTMEGLFMHGNVTGTGANIAAIHGCNMENKATIIMTNCGMSGIVVGAKESGLISGYFGTDKITLNGVWAIGTVTGSDNDTDAVFGRPNFGVTYNNCWSVKGNHSSIGTISADAAETGELAWKLNGESFVNPTWFQNLEEGDMFPSLNSSRGIVYPTVGGYTTFFPDDPEGFANFVNDFAGVAQAYLQSEDVTTYGGTVLVEEYTALVAAYNDVADLESFIPAWKAEQAKKAEVAASITAYKNYETVITEILAELESRDDFSGPARDFLENEYIDGGLQPGEHEDAPNGSSDYILDNRLLTASEVDQEAEYAKELLRLAVAGGYGAGTEITNLLVNANFAEGFHGWQGTLFTGHSADTREGSTMHAAEIWSAGAHDMYQEIVAAKAGVYELQVRGGYRPFNEEMSIQYYPYIYLNGNANYLQTVFEDYIPVEEAVDGENCNLDPNQVPDRAITNEEGDTIGWALHGTQSCNVAFTAGRYDNRILIKAEEGDTLRVGIKHPYSEFGAEEWVGIGDIHLTYHGELEESGEALDRVLKSMLARANTLLAIQYATDESYVRYPNYSQALKDRVAAAIEKAAGAADAATKYEVVEELSTAFVEIVECKKAYKNFFAKVEDAVALAYAAGEIDPNCGALGIQAEGMIEEGVAAYEAGTMTAEEANACEIINSLDIFPTIDENGAYHVANTAQYATFADMVNSGTNDVKLILDADVYMNTGMVMNSFYGDIDGQDHTITVDIVPSADNGAMIERLYGSHVQNLIIRGTINTAYKYAAGVAAHTYEDCIFDRIQSYVDINGTIGGDATHGGIVAVNETGTTYVNNSVFAGSMSGTGHSNGGIVGYSTNASVATGCLVIANITAPDNDANIIGRNKLTAKNCYFVIPYGGINEGATQITEEQLMSGEVTYGLNGGNCGEDAAWRQDLGTDVIPTLDPNHKIVYKTEDGTYTNAIPDGIQSVTDKKDNAKSRIYNINGIRVEKTAKGLYIIDGKKVFVK